MTNEVILRNLTNDIIRLSPYSDYKECADEIKYLQNQIHRIKKESSN